MRGKTKILTITIFAAVLSLVGSSKPANAATITSATTEDRKLVVTFGADYKVTAGTSVETYIKELPELNSVKGFLNIDKITIEEDEATNSIKVSLQEDAIKGDALLDGNGDGIYRKLIFGKGLTAVRVAVHFTRNDDGTWDYSKNMVSFLSKVEYDEEKEVEKQRDAVNELFEKAKASGKLEDLEAAKAAEEKLPTTSRDIAYWKAIVVDVEAKNATPAPVPTPAPAPVETAKEINKEAAPVAKEEKKTEVQAPNTGFEQTNAIFHILTSGIALAGATYFAIKKA